jgi:hypothetical protein
MASKNVSKKRKFVADGVFRAELNEFLVRELVSARAASLANAKESKKAKSKIFFFFFFFPSSQSFFPLLSLVRPRMVMPVSTFA